MWILPKNSWFANFVLFSVVPHNGENCQGIKTESQLKGSCRIFHQSASRPFSTFGKIFAQNWDNSAMHHSQVQTLDTRYEIKRLLTEWLEICVPAYDKLYLCLKRRCLWVTVSCCGRDCTLCRSSADLTDLSCFNTAIYGFLRGGEGVRMKILENIYVSSATQNLWSVSLKLLWSKPPSVLSMLLKLNPIISSVSTSTSDWPFLAT